MYRVVDRGKRKDAADCIAEREGSFNSAMSLARNLPGRPVDPKALHKKDIVSFVNPGAAYTAPLQGVHRWHLFGGLSREGTQVAGHGGWSGNPQPLALYSATTGIQRTL